jgi:ABC-type uncharacterized transport system ATPase subunit
MEIILLDEPARGIDVGAKGEIHRFIVKLIKKGFSVIVFSSEMPEKYWFGIALNAEESLCECTGKTYQRN